MDAPPGGLTMKSANRGEGGEGRGRAKLRTHGWLKAGAITWFGRCTCCICLSEFPVRTGYNML